MRNIFSPPMVKRRKRITKETSGPLPENPMFNQSACAKKWQGLDVPGRSNNRRLPASLAVETSLRSSRLCSIEIVRCVLHEAQELRNRDEQNNDSSESSSSLPTKRVWFDLDLNNEIEAASPTPLSEEEISQSWWTNENYKASADLCSKEVRLCIEKKEENVAGLVNIVSQCNQASCDELTDQMKGCFLECNVPRGAESDVAPVIKYLRSKHRDAVLGHFKKIPKHLKQDMRDRMLSARSIQYSRAHKMLARLLGEADAVSCKQYQSESTDSSQ